MMARTKYLVIIGMLLFLSETYAYADLAVPSEDSGNDLLVVVGIIVVVIAIISWLIFRKIMREIG
jgi:hypothetical protein